MMFGAGGFRAPGIGALSMIGIGGVALGVSFADALKRVGGLLIGRI